MPKKKKKPIVFIIFTILFAIYLALYYAFLGGYYEYKAYAKTSLTEEKMKEFENDIKEGKTIDIKNYISESKDYTNNVSKLGVKVGELSTKFITKGLGSFFKVLSKLVTN